MNRWTNFELSNFLDQLNDYSILALLVSGFASTDQRLDFGLNMETLGLNFSEKPFCDVNEHEFFDVWDSDINSVRL